MPGLPARIAQPARWGAAALLSLSVLSSLAVRLWLAGAPYWFDEVNTIYFVTQPLGRMLQFVANDVEVPAYYLLLFGWVRAVSDQPAATAVLSLLLDTAAACLLYRFGRTIFDVRTARFSLLFYLVSYASLYASTETRPYALLLVAALSSTTALWRLVSSVRRTRWCWVEYLTASLLGLATHFTFLFLIYAQNVAVVWFAWRRESGLPFPRWVAAQLGLLVAFSPFLATFLGHLGAWASLNAQTWTDEFATPTLGVYLQRAAIAQFLPDALPLSLAAGFGLLVALAAGSVFCRLQREPDAITLLPRQTTPAERYLFILGATLLVTFWPSGFASRRYLITLAPLFSLLLGHWFSRWRLSAVAALASSVLAAAIVVVNGWHFSTAFRQEVRYAWPEVAAYFNQRRPATEQRELILLTDWDAERQFRYSFRGVLPVVRFFPPTLVITADPEISQIRNIGSATVTADNVGELEGFIAGYRTVWLVVGDAVHIYDRGNAIVRWMDRRCRVGRELTFGAVRVRPYDCPPAL